MALLMWWMCVAFAAITMLGSTVTRSAVAAAGIGLLSMLVFGILAALPVVGDYSPSSLGGPALKLMLGQDPGPIAGPVLFNIVLVPALFFVTWLAFRRQEL
jgi:ABC-type transport system involved in multi-copper enzyme maturation permease subunit